LPDRLLAVLSWLFPLFNQLSGKIISHSIFENIRYLLSCFLQLLASSTGIYPALVLSPFKPVIVLKGKFASGTRGILLRKALVVSQSTISIGLIISTIIV
jgi:putative ABC transport system permease protein